MIYQKIPLSQTDPEFFLEVYAADQVGTLIRDALLVIPGGGYSCVCSDREGEPIALAFLARGLNAFVLHYSVGEKAKFPRPLLQASVAMDYIKAHAQEFHINPERVFACGFSAGGHLCASLGTMWHLPEIYQEAGTPFGSNRPKGMLLIYPVISASVATHMPSFYRILGTETPTRQELEQYSMERQVGEHTVPAFLVHTASDQVVSVENTLVMADALARYNIPFEVHIYPQGNHGVALANEITCRDEPELCIPAVANWVDQAVEWINQCLSPEQGG
ncbi:MAG: alpha/beta hydrolase [Clostridia bacterium]|nr:alpha/beta hydrolase [Clostridia bacterium]